MKRKFIIWLKRWFSVPRKSVVFTVHTVTDMDESMIQHCVICGDVISDYSNAMWPIDTDRPKGFPAGFVYISNTQPKILTRQLGSGEADKIIRCRP